MTVVKYNTFPEKVSIFWDIENCRPKMKSILEVVANIRNLVLQGRQVIRSLSPAPEPDQEGLFRWGGSNDHDDGDDHDSDDDADSSAKVLRQQMRKVVDTSGQPGRIVLISGWEYEEMDGWFNRPLISMSTLGASE